MPGDDECRRRNEMLNTGLRSGAGVETILFRKVVFEERRPRANVGDRIRRVLARLAGRGEEAYDG